MHNNNLGIHEIEDFESRFQSSGALHGFGSDEMPPVIFGDKGEAKHHPLKAAVERADKVDNALEGQTQSLRQSLVLCFSSDTTFSTKTSSANGFAVAHR
ncbi:MAG: hypothetical protein PUB00_02470 [Clostridiales bacterium]|nr:hypothetical protein [Clostridiales bacterium]